MAITNTTTSAGIPMPTTDAYRGITPPGAGARSGRFHFAGVVQEVDVATLLVLHSALHATLTNVVREPPPSAVYPVWSGSARWAETPRRLEFDVVFEGARQGELGVWLGVARAFGTLTELE